MDAVELQREFYRRTAGDYHHAHVAGGADVEHERALAALGGFVRSAGFRSVLDVGCGTGRALLALRDLDDTVRLMGLEPVAALRAEAGRLGVPEAELTDGDATALPFADDEFDCVCAFGVMHHLPEPRAALAEMLRVARRAVFVSDLNNYGCGSMPQRMVSHTLRLVRLWRTFQFVKNGFRHWKYDPDGDGLHFSYSLFDDLPYLRRHADELLLLTTRGSTGGHPLWDATHLAVLALQDDPRPGASPHPS